MKVDPRRPHPSALAPLATIIRNGGVVAIPTDTLYGLAADPFNEDAVRRIFAIKRRAPERAVPLIAADVAQVTTSLGALPALGRLLADHFWPGPLTLLLDASPHLASSVTGGLRTVGVRVPNHQPARLLAAACLTPLTATSANISGQPPTADPDDVMRQLGEALDGLLDAGVLAGGAPSTIVDVTQRPVVLVRPGAVDWKEIEACLLE